MPSPQRARRHGSAAAALEAAGIQIPEAEQLDALDDDQRAVIRSGQRRPASQRSARPRLSRRTDCSPKADSNAPGPDDVRDGSGLVVRAAEGESILRLPWFEEGLFVGRQLPDIFEIPRRVRLLACENYRAALNGERTRYSFTSYGHTYSVDAVPVRRSDGRIESVMAVATPDRSYETARSADERPPELTSRKIDVLTLASHGLTYREIADQIVVSPATVKTHLANIDCKLRVSDKAAAVAAALRHGLIA
jgi:DNA-binding CsgD family transcriptional regulator